MDCGLASCAGSLGKQRSLKAFRNSTKYGDVDIAEREWPVDPTEYEMLHQAGKGAHAAVYCARCKPFNETVAIKKLDLDSNCNWDLTALIREATLMKKFHHSNVLPLRAAFVVGRELWMVMPYMGQGSVRSIMKRDFPEGLDEVVIATIMYPVLLGLEYVHKNGGIHRDVKADNILISEAGEVCLGDFGVAAARTRDVSMINLKTVDMEALMATTFVGTPCWMAPEVMEQTEGYNSSADMWSFGITLIELAHGRPPLARLHPMRVLIDTLNNPPPSLDDDPLGHRFSKCMKEAVEACLQKDPTERATASTLLNHRFFRVARDADFLVTHFLSGLSQREVHTALPGWAGPPVPRCPSAAGLGRLKSTWYFPATKLEAHEEDEGGEEEAAAKEEADAGAETGAVEAAAVGAGAGSGQSSEAVPCCSRAQQQQQLDEIQQGQKHHHHQEQQEQKQQQQQHQQGQQAAKGRAPDGVSASSIPQQQQQQQQQLLLQPAEQQNEQHSVVEVQVLLRGSQQQLPKQPAQEQHGAENQAEQAPEAAAGTSKVSGLLGDLRALLRLG